MARREARSALVKLRVTEAEKEAVEVAAGAAGLSVSDYARRLLLAVPVVLRQGTPLESVPRNSVTRVEAERAQDARAARPALPSRNAAGLLWCPVPLCQYRAVGESKCPIHGRDTERI